MSYARWTEGDVYVFGNVDGGFTCMSCQFMPKCENSKFNLTKDFQCNTIKEMLDHLKRHEDEGHEVPPRAIKRLKEELNILEKLADDSLDDV